MRFPVPLLLKTVVKHALSLIGVCVWVGGWTRTHVKLLEFLVDANRRIHQGLSLRCIKEDDLKILYNFDWSVFLLHSEERAESSGFSFLQQLKQQSGCRQSHPEQKREGTNEPISRSRVAQFRQRSGLLLVGSEDAGDSDVAERIDGRDAIINQLLSTGTIMMRQGVFALPKLAWTQQQEPDEARVLEMTGFLLDAYHKDAWWWEVFETFRRLSLTGALMDGPLPAPGHASPTHQPPERTIALGHQPRT